MRIVVLTNSYPTEENPYNQIFVKRFVQGIGQSSSIDVKVVYNKIYDWVKGATNKKNILWTFLKYISSVLSFLNYFFFYRKKQDIIFAQAVIYNSFYAFIIKYFFKNRYVIYVHGGDVNSYDKFTIVNKWIIRKSLENADYVIANSLDIKDKLYQISRIKNLEVISPGVDTSVFYSIEGKANPKSVDLGIEKRDKVVTFVGNAIERKGIRTYLNAVERLKTFLKEESVKLIFVTEGPMVTFILQEIDRIGLFENVILIPKMSPSELNFIYNLSHILVFPSLKEPLGLVGLEAMASGVLVIGSETGGIKEYIKNNKNGFLFEPGNSEHLAELLKSNIEKYDIDTFRNEMSKTVENYSLLKTVERLTDLFNDIYTNRVFNNNI